MPLDPLFDPLRFAPSSARLDLLSHQGRWAPDPEAGAEALIDAVSNPQWRNEDLLRFTLLRANRCAPAEHDQWIANLLEFCVWESLSQPRRLLLCQELIARGAPFSHEPAWSHFGGLAHVAAEAGSLEALRWAREMAPDELWRPGGPHGLTPLHCAAMRSDEQAVAVIEALAEWGLDGAAQTRDGRNPLFRAQAPEVAQALMRAGADPLAPDRQGFCALGFWLEAGFWDLARLCFSPQNPRASLNEPLRYGSFRNPGSPPSRDLPAAIFAGSAHAARSEGFVDGILEMAAWGADFHLPGPCGAAPISRLRRGPAVAALAALERSRLEQGVPMARASKESSRL